MVPCTCSGRHTPKRIVLTGGPGAGKTAALDMVRHYFCRHVQVLPEAASLLFRGGFPRGDTPAEQRALQLAIFHVQRQLEAYYADSGAAILLCDRGTVDGAAYWPGPDTLWEAVGTTREAEIRRYDAVFHLRTPPAGSGYDLSNPVRIETAAQAQAIDARIDAAWDGHPRRCIIPSTVGFIAKARLTMERLREEMPPCCRQGHQLPDDIGEADGSVRAPD